MNRKTKAEKQRAKKDMEALEKQETNVSASPVLPEEKPSPPPPPIRMVPTPANKVRIRNNLQFLTDDNAMQWLLHHNFQPELRMLEGLDDEGEKVKTPVFGLDLTFVVFGKDINMLASRVRRLCALLTTIDQEFLDESKLQQIIDDGVKSPKESDQ